MISVFLLLSSVSKLNIFTNIFLNSLGLISCSYSYLLTKIYEAPKYHVKFCFSYSSPIPLKLWIFPILFLRFTPHSNLNLILYTIISTYFLKSPIIFYLDGNLAFSLWVSYNNIVSPEVFQHRGSVSSCATSSTGPEDAWSSLFVSNFCFLNIIYHKNDHIFLLVTDYTHSRILFISLSNQDS